MLLRFGTFFLSLFALWSCNVQDIEKYNSDFSGTWRTAPFYSPSAGDSTRNYLTIDGKDSGIGIGCKIDCPFCDCLTFFVGRVKINTSNSTMQIGPSVGQIFRVEKEPFVNDNGEWELMLENLSYFKYEE